MHDPTDPDHEKTRDADTDGVGAEDYVPDDDAVIGRAFRRSLVALAGVAAVAVVALLMRQGAEPEGDVVEIDVAPPLAARKALAPEVAFVDVTVASGIDFVHFSGATGEKLLPETMGGAAAFVDIDDDGHQDLVFANGADWPHDPPTNPGPAIRVYRNDGSGGFTDVTEAAGFTESFYAMGVAAADVDGDGDVDLYVTAVGPNRLYRNDGGRFEDVTEEAGVAGGREDWSTAASFFDADGDGDLDLFVGNYVRWSREIDSQVDYRLTGIGRAYGPPVNYEGTYPVLYRNGGDGRFTDVSAEVGVRVESSATGGPVAKTLGVAPVDVDADGFMDIFVANDTVRNFFFHNRGDGTFEETGEYFGLAYDRNGLATGAMGIDAGDYRNDGELGFLIGNFANEMTSVFVTQGDPTLFADEAITEGIGAPTRTALSFGVLLLDYDLDGRLDLLQSNGHLEDEIGTVDPSQSYAQPVQLFWNAGPSAPRTFVEVPAESTGDLGQPIVGRGSSFADVDGDGDLDVLVLQVGGPPRLLRNEQSTGHHWLRIALAADGSNRHGIGAWIELQAGGVTQRRQVMPTSSYLSQVELPVTFGLGDTDRVEHLVIRWPDGTEQPVAIDGVDRHLTIRKEG